MDTQSPETFRAFSRALETDEGKTKVNAKSIDYIKSHIREESFYDKVCPPRTVQASDPRMQRSMEHDTLVYISQAEPDTYAMTGSFRAQPEVHYFYAQRFEVVFYDLKTPRFEKNERELEADLIPLERIVKDLVKKDVVDVHDRRLLEHTDWAIGLNQQANGMATVPASLDPQLELADAQAFTLYNIENGTVDEIGKCKSVDLITGGTGVDNAADGITEDTKTTLQKDDIQKLLDLFDGIGEIGSGRQKVRVGLATTRDWNSINVWGASVVGDGLAEQTTVRGYKSNTLMGVPFIRTAKTDILRPGNIYAFAPQDYWGEVLQRGGLKVYFDKERENISFEMWRTQGHYFANVMGARKLELYAGSAENTATANADLVDRFRWKDESELGKKHHLVERDGIVPQVTNNF